MYVIGDFDSAHQTNSLMKGKWGTVYWTRPKAIGVDYAVEDDDWYAFGKVKERLVTAQNENLREYEDIGKEVSGISRPEPARLRAPRLSHSAFREGLAVGIIDRRMLTE